MTDKLVIDFYPVAEPIIGNGMLGNVYNHPFHPDGTFVVTSPIIAVRNNPLIAETKTYLYKILTYNHS